MTSLKIVGCVVLVLLLGTLLEIAHLHAFADHQLLSVVSEVENRSNSPQEIVSLSSQDSFFDYSSTAVERSDDPTPSRQDSASTVPIIKYSSTVHIRSKEAFLWKGAQSRLCKRIKREKQKLENRNSTNTTLNLYLELPCKQIHDRNQHGNFLMGFYGMKLAAMHFQVDFTFHCHEDVVANRSSDRNKKYLFWWLQSLPNKRGFLNESATDYGINNTLYRPPIPSKEGACKGVGKVALHYTSELARRDLRAMATMLKPSFKRNHETMKESRSHTFRLDEVAIHFRCGDILSKSIPKSDNNYGLLQFRAYRDRIPANVTSIGIVTAPLAASDSRSQDRVHTPMCRAIVDKLVRYLRLHFPRTKVKVRNDPKESIPQVMSRMILANYSFCVRSTFCLFPALASFGTSYVQAGGLAWFFEPISEVYDNIFLMQGNFLKSAEINEKGFNYTLEWLVSEKKKLPLV
ncbi:hypothetical protein IV203_030090 [Nitzschia inconspicua]|uniref:Uncharacterized protein n=1 Tax=Nitzschia inconspicua TaxID=303405 RepID=A0A9K3LSY7_9STRA|nr:hypothetical protein IV203_030090 [Nitzschia inconspicua]